MTMVLKWIGSLDEASFLDFDVLAAIGVHLHCSGLEDASTVDGIESFPEELGGETDLAQFLRLFLLGRQVLLELIGFLAKLPSLSDAACLFLSGQLFLLDLLSL
jgi:hypothetical protein